MNTTLRLLLLVGLLAGRLFAQNSGTSLTYNVTGGASPSFQWNANGAEQTNTTSAIAFDLVGSTSNGYFATTITNHGGGTITATISGLTLVDFAFYENNVLKQEGSSNSYTPTSSTVIVKVLAGGIRFEMQAAKGPDVNVWAPIVQGMAGNPKKIQLTKPGELGAQSGSKLKYRVGGGGVSEASGSSVQITMSSGTTSLEFWSTADGFADSVHQFTTWNELML